MKKEQNNIIIYQADNGEIKLRADLNTETVWASLDQIASLFDRDKSVISRHISNIFKEGELVENSVVAKNATTASDGKIYQVTYYNLDVIISVGYRVNSNVATKFRQWATKTLKDHIVKGYTMNESRIRSNYEQFLRAVEDIKALSFNNPEIKTDDVLELVKAFASTWFSLDAYDKDSFSKKGYTKRSLEFEAESLYQDIETFKKELIKKGEATDFFAKERSKNNLKGILGNVFQSAFGKDVYETIEEKAAHLLYFIIKDHPFIDGNKRSAAFSFVWFLRKAGLDFRNKIIPEALTALTLLVAESDSKERSKITGLIILLLKK
jgi:death-on-curing family protein